MIRLKCPSCACVLGLDEAQVGQSAFCPSCGLVFTVPPPAVLLEPTAEHREAAGSGPASSLALPEWAALLPEEDHLLAHFPLSKPERASTQETVVTSADLLPADAPLPALEEIPREPPSWSFLSLDPS